MENTRKLLQIRQEEDIEITEHVPPLETATAEELVQWKLDIEKKEEQRYTKFKEVVTKFQAQSKLYSELLSVYEKDREEIIKKNEILFNIQLENAKKKEQLLDLLLQNK